MILLQRVQADSVPAIRRTPLDAQTLLAASEIVEDVRTRGMDALLEHAHRLGDLQPGQPVIIDPHAMRAALDALDPQDRRVLEQAAERIDAFARAQRRAITDLTMSVPGGEAGHWIAPVERAGCYAPGGRFPLPSSALMTAITARAAGVREVIVASPRPAQITLAAAALANADALLAAGGAQAIGALAYGAGPIAPMDAVVGPGNRWVTAAKQLVSGQVAIDMLAGPSELLIIADHTAHAGIVAADLLAQAEHDTDARVVLITTDARLLEAVEHELNIQLGDLPTAPTARGALQNSYAVVVGTIDQAIAQADRYAPEHLQILTQDAMQIAQRCNHYGGVFIGQRTAEVFGDYGLGPNHTLPTGGTARSFAGLSVLNFLRVRTWLHTPGATPASDIARLARLEGLEAHARSAEKRM